MKEATILHLSDLHLTGEDKERNNILEVLFVKLEEDFKDSAWVPDYVAISGDIAARGTADDYLVADDFVNKLYLLIRKANSTLEKSDFIFAPGNHDKQRGRIEKSLVKAEEFKKVESYYTNTRTKYDKNFFEFNKFCNKFHDTKDENFTTYTKSIENVFFIVFNTALYCLDSKFDHGRLTANSNNLLKVLDDTKKPESITVTLMHHPPEWLYYDIISEKAEIDEIVESSDIILAGHEHRITPQPSLLNSKTPIFYGGATINNETLNSFSILRLNPLSGKYFRRVYIYIPQFKNQGWIKQEFSGSFRKPLYSINSNEIEDMIKNRILFKEDSARLEIDTPTK